MALDIWNTLTVEVGGSGVEIHGEGALTLKKDTSNLVYRSLRIPFTVSGTKLPSVKITCRNHIPVARGLGSSSAAILSGLVAGNELCGKPIPTTELLDLAREMEGHPDNITPALLGGCQIAVQDGDHLVTSEVPIPDNIRAVLYIPDMHMPTEGSRQILPDDVPMKDAVYNIGRMGVLVNALWSGEMKDLVIGTQDRLHQPARQKMFPQMKVMFQAALESGAIGVFLSGGGSSVLALTNEKEMTVGYEMADAASKAGLTGIVRITRPTKNGVHVTSRD